MELIGYPKGGEVKRPELKNASIGINGIVFKSKNNLHLKYNETSNFYRVFGKYADLIDEKFAQRPSSNKGFVKDVTGGDFPFPTSKDNYSNLIILRVPLPVPYSEASSGL